MIHYQAPIDPPDEEETGAYTCCECGENIPGGEIYYEVGGNYYCEDCIKSMRSYAPYKGEV
jgi:hypothetical protein